MSKIKLFVAPGSCARVPTILLAHLGISFETELVRFKTGEHKSEDYRRFNPKGKVPALLIDGEALTENVAIIYYLNELFPGGGLMPPAENELERARQIADLCFCSATLHPIVTRIRIPIFFAEPESAKKVWMMGCAAMDEYFQLIENRLAVGPWWYGDQWSAMDAYLFWVFWRVEGAQYNVSRFPRFVDHAKRMDELPSVNRAIQIEEEAIVTLKAEGNYFEPPSINR